MKRVTPKYAAFSALCVVIATATVVSLQAHSPLQGETNATPPGPPPEGPGSAQSVALSMKRVQFGSGAKGGWLFLPDDPAPRKAPVIVFCHGWGAIQPNGYMAWIRHIVERGNIVVWLNYQDSLLTPPPEFLPNAIAGLKDAIKELHRHPAGVQPDMERFAVTGHSAGGNIAAGLAATAEQNGLPGFKAVMPVEPGKSNTPGVRKIPLADVSTMPDSTLLLVIIGDEDMAAGKYDAYRIYNETTRVPTTNKNLLEIESDRHGTPALIANHFAPAAAEVNQKPRLEAAYPSARPWIANAAVVDALDYYGTWKLLDALTDAAFYGRNRDVALGGTPQQLYMGVWSDGVPVKPMRVLR